jgi:hypothetical protein
MHPFRLPVTYLAIAVIIISTFVFLTQAQAMVSSNFDTPGEQISSTNIKAHLVFQFDPTHQIVRSIQISNPLSGLEALQNSGLEVITHDFGGGFIAVCSIDGVGCPADECFCSSKFWNYEYWDGNEWQGYDIGPADSTVNAGDVEGWRWSDFGVGGLSPAPVFLAAYAGLDWLALQQADSGTYGSPSSDVETLLTIGANDYSAATWRKTPDSVALLAPIMAEGPAFTQQGAGQSGKFSVGLIAADGCWPYGALAPPTYYNSDTGQYFVGAFNHSWAILGTLALGEAVPENALEYLRGLVQPNGGWEWSPGLGTDTNSTSLVIQTLIATGENPDTTLILDGLDYLKSAQNLDGGFTYDPHSEFGTDSDTNSTAYAVQAILAAGQDPTAGMWVMDDTNPINYLLDMQLPDGSFEWQTGFGSNLMATQQAIPALLGRILPLKTNAPDACSTIFMPLVASFLP